jgi:hypothetical protein
MAKCCFSRSGIVALGLCGLALILAPRAAAQEDLYDASADYLRVWDGLTQGVEEVYSKGGATEGELRSLRLKGDEARRKAVALQRALERFVRGHKSGERPESAIDTRVAAALRGTPTAADVVARAGGGHAVLMRAIAELQSVPVRVDRLLGRAVKTGSATGAEAASSPQPGLKCVLLGAHVVASALDGAPAERETRALAEICGKSRP